MSGKIQIKDLGKFGTLQTCELQRSPNKTGCPFADLIQHSSDTPCNLALSPIDSCLSPDLRRLIDQTNTPSMKIYVTKTADGLVFSKPSNSSPGVHRLIAGMYGKSLYDDDSKDPIQFFSIADKPKCSNSSEFHLKLDNSISDVHEISRHSITKHIYNQINAVSQSPFGETSKTVFDSPNIGTLSSRILVGPEVHDMKCAFLKMVQKAAKSGTGVYDKTIRLKPEFGKLLMLKYAQGDVQCNRCVDGLVVTRMRKHNGKRSLVLVVNSNDFHSEQPSDDPETSCAQAFKVDYSDTGSTGPRIVVVDTKEDAANEEEEHVVSLDSTVQEILNTIEYSFRHKVLEDHGCHLFPMYCDLLDQQNPFRRTCRIGG